jgi:hypothetical protein
MLATPLVVAEYTGKPRSIYYTELEQGKKKKGSSSQRHSRVNERQKDRHTKKKKRICASLFWLKEG